MKSCHLNRLRTCPAYATPSVAASWTSRHCAAIMSPRDPFERALVELLTGWLRYADAHESAYGSPVGDDGVLGLEWARIGEALRGLLNGHLGRLDGGTLDSLIARTLEAVGAHTETL